MYCNSCGTQIAESAAFCSRCGKPSGTGSLMPHQGRIAGHVRLLGILWLAMSAFRLIPGLFLMAFAGTRIFPEDIPPFFHVLLPAIGLCFLIVAGIGIAIGWGLLTRQSWARMMTIVFGAIGLIDIPFGTALGIYTLWVLLPAESEQEYRTMASAA
jgi:zinc ribbon protein